MPEGGGGRGVEGRGGKPQRGEDNERKEVPREDIASVERGGGKSKSPKDDK